MNVRFLRRVKRHILEEPSRLRMTDVVRLGTPGTLAHFCAGWGEPVDQRIPACGAVGCIAGWALILSGRKDETADMYDAAPLLGIKSPEVADTLFNVDYWPKDLGDKYKSAKTKKRRSELVAKRIDQFIEERKGEQ